MSETAYKTLYRQEVIDGFEIHSTLLRPSVTHEFMNDGQNCVFLVADSGSETATTRGADGDIVYGVNNNTQLTCTLVPWYAGKRFPNFNIFASQGDQKMIGQKGVVSIINRKIDSDIITVLDTATVVANAAQKGDVELTLKSKVILANAKVPNDGNISMVITPSFSAYLLMATEFNNIQYVNSKPLEGNSLNWRDQPQAYRWNNITFIEHPSLTGVGTASAKCYMYHKNAIGHAFNANDMKLDMGYEGQHARSWVLAEAFMGSKKLQNSGIVQVLHDDSSHTAV